MATRKNTRAAPALTIAEKIVAQTSPPRAVIALQAAWETEALADALIEASQDLDPEDMAIRGLAIRIRELSSVVMSALSDHMMETDADLKCRLTGLRTVAHEAQEGCNG